MIERLPTQPSKERIAEDIQKLATFVDPNKPGWTRRPFTSWYEQGRVWLKQQMQDLGMDVRYDAASNLIGTLPGSDESLKPILVGSHTDTVTGGGRFDGIIGVVASLELVRVLQESRTRLRHPLEVVDFTAEEPSEFGISTIGSRAMVNNLSEEMLLRQDPNGLVLKEAIHWAGGQPNFISQLSRKTGDVAIYLELHIEQGPVLEQSAMKLGVVTGIVGIHRYRIIVEGVPNHAGTTPMTMRSDALTSASELILELEAIARQPYSDPVVGTIGRLQVEPNASNVIPGRVVFELEIRSLSVEILEQMLLIYREKANQIAEVRGVHISFDSLSKSEPIRVDVEVQQVIREACSATASTISLPSGAGHDGNQLSRIAPIGMIFVPSKEGRSHCPEEWTDYEDVTLGVWALIRSVITFDQKLDS
ncbi:MULTISPECIES: Zn-dependent hydrolase [unclassified Paenibacillus]|uniref:N-carbamoyl-L-glutamic acid amidohydrolase n=1 Tax=Paenibacillus sp. (strain Soil724D2) TaxID=1736392 RepID=ERTE_PAES7|nr:MULTISPECIES: Zn-dependent hydrolase [unclassified Paenibacillus]KQX48926.1 Zn-dependent hydrolase [Paenibacillus sp. Root444D2]KRE36544.1 Zn-dependent hydrolase [Paenibacillus sp. Soil724D2]